MEGDRGVGAWENRGREGYGRREEKGREAGFPKWREPGEKGEKFRNIALHFTKEIEQREENPYGRGREAGVRSTGGGSFRPPVSPTNKLCCTLVVWRARTKCKSYHYIIDLIHKWRTRG